MVETLSVVGIVSVVVVLTGRSLYRTLTGKNDGCGGCNGACSGCGVKSLADMLGEQDSRK